MSNLNENLENKLKDVLENKQNIIKELNKITA